MPQQYSQKVVNTFVKGLVTEASPMTFPENTSYDELNCDLLKNGSRRRRKGIFYEDNYQNSTFSVASGALTWSTTWYNVSGIGGTEFLVIQVDNMVYFYDKSYDTISANQKSFSINLNDYSANNGTDPGSVPISCDSITGYLIIVSPAIEPIRVEYILDSDSIIVSKIIIEIRDYEYLGMSSNITFIARSSNTVTVTTNTAHALSVGDSVEVESSRTEFNGTFTVVAVPTTTTFTYTKTGSNFTSSATTGFVTKDLSPEIVPSSITNNYKYDLYNQGWYSDNNDRSGTAFEYWDSNRTTFPPRNKPWWIGKNSSNQQDLAEFDKIEFGNTLFANGHYIVNFFSRNRSGVSGITGLTTITESARFKCVAAYAGRIWYAGLDSTKNGGKILYSKTIEDKNDFGHCYQKEDPTSEDTPGLVDSDGGYIIIPDIADIKALITTGSTLYILASNGIWSIGGVDQVFKATEYFVNKVSSFGAIGSRSIVMVNDAPVWWDSSGIYTLSIDPKEGTKVFSISDNIKSFYDSIPNHSKAEACGIFDKLEKKIYWLYEDAEENIAQKRNNILIFDVDLQAFYPWKISDTAGTSPYLISGFYLSGQGSSSTTYNILVGTDQVIDSSSNTIVEDISSSDLVNTDIKFFVRTSDGYLTIALFKSRDFLDWGSADYDSFVETGYDFMGDATRKKNIPYITSYLKRTEESFVLVNGDYEADYPSGCILTVKWDLSGDSSRWSTPSQLYRMVNYPIVDPNNLTFNYPYETVVNRTKVRGKGRVMKMRFESEEGKDFYLIGWETINAANPRY